jgi:micrococcal nuclease
LVSAPTSQVGATSTSAAAAASATVTTVSPTTARPATTRPATTAPPATTRPPTTAPPATRPPAPALSVKFVSLPATGQGNRVTATVRTAPGAACSIEVEYASGPSGAAGLDPAMASGSGVVSWTWLVGTRTTPGDWSVTVTCSKGSDSQTDVRYLTVLDTGKSG